MKKYTKIALADDHVLLRNALATLIDGFGDCEVVIQASTGKELIEQVEAGTIPEIVLLDLSMPEMDGFETATWLKNNYPAVHVLMLTMYNSELTLIRLLHAGVKGFLKKDIHPDELKFAIESVMRSGYYYSIYATDKLVNLFRQQPDNSSLIEKNVMNETEIKFLQLTSTEMTYKEIALEMGLNPRAVDNLRDNLFEKLSAKSRVGLAMYAIRQGLVNF
ncbi:MAG: DNA-binding response regulator [Chitinophagaceae bacterium]|nr:DNA-binding response regulator [Chitinophagaceae bacterium]